ncbi:MAG: GldG family protein [Clostridiales bacterium]|jgi:hypothetical protein|nr:GldG family protein [Clostridiales bacterium]
MAGGNHKLSEKTKRRLKYGTNSVVLIIAVAVIAVLLNLLIERVPLKVDLTSQKLYSISQTTKDTLSSLTKEVDIYALYDRVKGESDDSQAAIIQILDKYAAYKDVKVSYVDPVKDPSFLNKTAGSMASDFNAGDYLVKCGDHIKRINQSYMYTYGSSVDMTPINTGLQAETVLTSAIINVTSDFVPGAYISTGNGEANFDDFIELRKSIEDLNFNVQTLDITTTDIPDDAVLLVFLNPRQDLPNMVEAKLEQWLINKSGNAIFLMDPDNSGTDFANFKKVMKLYNLTINDDMVEEKNYFGGNKYWFQATVEKQGPFASLQGSGLVNIFETRSISILQIGGTDIKPLAVLTSSQDATSDPVLSGGQASKGKQIIAAVSSAYSDTSNIFVAGSSKGMSDEFVNDYDESSLTMIKYVINWMHQVTNKGDFIQAKTYDNNVMIINHNTTQFLGIFSIIILPFAIMLVGGIVWFRRRHL